MIPVLDLFAGPGGLGEGFSSFRPGRSRSGYQLVLSIEKDSRAHSTLELRSFFRNCGGTNSAKSYYAFLRGEIGRDELFSRDARAAERARDEAWHAELGSPQFPPNVVHKRIGAALAG